MTKALCFASRRSIIPRQFVAWYALFTFELGVKLISIKVCAKIVARNVVSDP
jgi:hypothetical protein